MDLLQIFFDKHDETIGKLYNLKTATLNILRQRPIRQDNIDTNNRIRKTSCINSKGENIIIREWEYFFANICEDFASIYKIGLISYAKTNIDIFLTLRLFIKEDNNIKDIINYKMQMEINEAFDERLDLYIKESNIFIDYINTIYEQCGIDLISKIEI